MSYARQMLDSHPRTSGLDAGVLAATVDALTDCAQACSADADADLGELWRVLIPADSRPWLCLADQAGVLHA
jgi:hypothetical protein